jgi:hypothetical protein
LVSTLLLAAGQLAKGGAKPKTERTTREYNAFDAFMPIPADQFGSLTI